VALGKLGGREMSAASDLDLILLYDFDETAPASDGARPLPGGLYFARLTQRLVAALSVPTAEGALYQVDFRLRPSGNSGPLATHIEAFREYQAKEAWTWEHLALTRARPIAGDADLIGVATKTIGAIVRRPRERDKLAHDLLEMRALIETAKGGEGAWDLKIAAGGMVDIEFIAQYLQLLHADAHPDLLSTETEAVLTRAAKAGLLPAADADILLPALRLYQALTQILRLCVEGPFDPAAAPRGLLALLARAGELPDFPTLDRDVRDTETAVSAAFEQLIGEVPEGAASSKKVAP
jgi:glutamate-ammonia-ligase adenylyltransferase